MSTPPKPASFQTDPSRGANLYRVAIVGAASLKGKEVAEMLNDRNFPAIDVKLLDDDESLGQLETMGDEVTFIQSVRAEQFDRIDFAFFASDQECTRKNWTAVRRAGGAIIDLSYALEDEPGAAVRSPWIERELGKTVPVELQPGPAVTAHPAATVLAIQQLPKAVFDAQVAFNMVTRYGEQSAPSLENIERRVLKHYELLVGEQAPKPSLLLVQAPIFHGHAFSMYVELEQSVAVGDLAQALAGEHITITRGAEEAPSNVNAAGQGEILLTVTRDANNENGYWLWAASDNLRIAAATAVESAETMVATRPRGKIQ